MKKLTFSPMTGKDISAYGSSAVSMLGGVTLAAGSQLSHIRLAAGGVLGFHAAPCDQLLYVLSGQIQCRSGDGSQMTAAAEETVLFFRGEEHETTSQSGALLLIVESPDITARLAEQSVSGV